MPIFIQISGPRKRQPLWPRWLSGAVIVGAMLLALDQKTAFGQSALTRALTTKTEPAANAPAARSTAPETDSVIQAINEKLALARIDLAALDRFNSANLPAGISTKDMVLRRGLQERLVRLYEQQLGYVDELDAARSRRAELAAEAKNSASIAKRISHSVLEVDALREGIQTERLEIANGEKALATLDILIQENRDTLKQADEKIRQINEQLERNPAAMEGDARLWPRELERLRSQTASASLASMDLERQIQQERLAGSRIRLGLLQQQLVRANAGVTFSEADMEQVSSRLDAEGRRLNQQLQTALARQTLAEEALAAAKKSFEQIQNLKNAAAGQISRAAEELELCGERVETERTSAELLRSMLQVNLTERTIWELRFTASQNNSLGTIRQVRTALEQFDRRVQLWLDYYRRQLESNASQIALLETRLGDMSATSELVPLVRQRVETLRERDQMLLQMVRNIERGGRLLERLHESLAAEAKNLPFFSRVSDVFSDTRMLMGRIWSFELFVAQDTITVDGQQITGKRSVTLGKVVTAILILVLGYWVIGWVTRLLEPVFVKRFKIERNQATLIRRWLRVALVFTLAVFSLVSVKIPLTVFAFAGGALAIGLGFGLQTILKNFVSGIIILFERPFRVGDVLDVTGQRGTVSSIGIRSSVLEMWDGTETLIPNSALLENNLTNWTYSSRAVRFSVTVGVAYGSDTRRVVQLLGEIAERHGLVEKDPKPQVLFTDFGASSLDFELRFWVDVVKSSSPQVASDLRQMIAGTFAEYGIVIAFPQQDVHFDTVRPIQVQLMPAPEPPPASKPGEVKPPKLESAAPKPGPAGTARPT